MPGMMGGIPGQIAGDFKGIATEAVKQAVQATKDIAKGATIEQISVAPSQASAQAASKGVEQGTGGNDPQAQAKKKEAERKRFEEVRSELSQYIERKRQLDAKIAQEKQQEEQKKAQNEAKDKKKRESWTAQLLKRISGQSHGESMKSKD